MLAESWYWFWDIVHVVQELLHFVTTISLCITKVIMHLSMSSLRGVGQPTGIWLWRVSPGWRFSSFDLSITNSRKEVNHLLLILLTIIFCLAVGNLIIFVENVKIPTLWPTHHPLAGLTLIGALGAFALKSCYILRWLFITFCINVIPFCVSITFCSDPSYILR